MHALNVPLLRQPFPRYYVTVSTIPHLVYFVNVIVFGFWVYRSVDRNT